MPKPNDDWIPGRALALWSAIPPSMDGTMETGATAGPFAGGWERLLVVWRHDLGGITVGQVAAAAILLALAIAVRRLVGQALLARLEAVEQRVATHRSARRVKPERPFSWRSVRIRSRRPVRILCG